MKKSIWVLFPLSLMLTQSAKTEELVTEIKSGEYCQSKLFKQFKKVEQTDHERTEFAPSPKLLSFVTSMELMCPWESQRDFNGDKLDDWIGMLKSGSEFQLISYMSDRQGYKFEVIARYPKAPSNSFIRWLPTAQLKKYSKNNLPIKNLKYALQVSDLEGMTEFYLWNGTKMNSVLKTPQIF